MVVYIYIYIMHLYTYKFHCTENNGRNIHAHKVSNKRKINCDNKNVSKKCFKRNFKEKGEGV